MTSPSSQRLAIAATDRDAYGPMLALEKMRASQLNHCAYCLDMHAAEGRKAGVSQRKLDVLAGWHEAPSLYSAREQAALAFTGQVTRVADGGVDDNTWNAVQTQFSEQESVQPLMAICAINSWNRMAISTHQALPDK